MGAIVNLLNFRNHSQFGQPKLRWLRFCFCIRGHVCRFSHCFNQCQAIGLQHVPFLPSFDSFRSILQSVSILGYSNFPLMLALLISAIFSLGNLLRFLLALVAFVWSTRGKPFSSFLPFQSQSGFSLPWQPMRKNTWWLFLFFSSTFTSHWTS